MAGSPEDTQIVQQGIAGGGATIAPFVVSSVWVPVVGAITALVALAVTKLFHFGPDPNNVPAAKVEQTFELAADYINDLYKANYINQATAISLANAMISALGNAELQVSQAIKDSKPFKQGVTHGTAVISAEINLMRQEPDSPLVSWDASKAMDVYHITGPNVNFYNKPGWYPEARQNSMQIVDGIVAQIDKQNSYNVAGVSISKSKVNLGLLAAAGIVAWEVISEKVKRLKSASLRALASRMVRLSYLSRNARL